MPAVLGNTYEAISDFSLVSYYQAYQVLPDCGSECNAWYDPFGYESIASTRDGSYTWSVTTWAPSIIAIYIANQVIHLDQSGAKAVLPWKPNVHNLKFRAFLPPKWVRGLDYCDFISPNVLYHGDNRTFNPFSGNFRAGQEFFVQLSTGSQLGTPKIDTGISKRYAPDALTPSGDLIDDAILHDCHYLDDEGKATTDGMAVSTSGSPGNTSSWANGNESNPVAPLPTISPGINWTVNFNLFQQGTGALTAYFFYAHDCFPSFEAYIDNRALYLYPTKSLDSVYLTYCLAGYGPEIGYFSKTF